MTTTLALPCCEGLRFLAQEAKEAHLAGDGIRVLHHCRVAFDYLGRQSRSKALGDLTIEDVRWCFSLALYWAFGDYEFMVIHQLLKAIPSRDAAQCDGNVLSYVLSLLDNPFSAQPTAELIALPQAWLALRSDENADIALLTLAVELTWTRDPFGDSWQEMAKKWGEGADAESALAVSLRQLLERLRYQTYLTLGKWPTRCGPEDTSPDVPPLAEAYRLFTECNWETLDGLIRRQVPRIRIEDPSYIALFNLIHQTRFYRGSGDDQLVSLSRYNLSASHQPMQVYLGLRQRSYLDHSLQLARVRGSGGGAGDRVATFRLGLLAELSALRAWDLMAWRYAVGEQAQVALELAAQRFDAAAEIHFAKLGIVHAVKALQCDEKDERFQRAVERLDAATTEDREEVVRNLLSAHPAEWADAYVALRLISDAIPETLLPDVAQWSVGLETTGRRVRSQRCTWLGFWGDILGYVPFTSELVVILKPALELACRTPTAWHEIAEGLHKALVGGPLEIAVELMNTMVAHPLKDQPFSRQRWGTIFNACANRGELRDRFLPWLRDGAGGDATLRNHVRRMESGFPAGPIEDVELRESLMREASQFVAAINHPKTGPFSMFAGLSQQPFSFVTWTDAQIPFVNELAKAIDTANALPGEKLCLFQVLAAIVQTGSDGVVDAVARNAIRWLAGSVPYFDPHSKYSGPLSIFTFSGGGPEMLERGLWWLGHALLRRQSEVVRGVLTTRVLQKGSYVSSDVVDIAFAVMIHLALTAPLATMPTSMAIVGMSEALTAVAAPSDLGRLIRTFAALLEGDDVSVGRLGDNDVGRMLLECWARRLPIMAQESSAEVRAAVARVLRVWSRLPATFSWVSVPQQIAACLEDLKSDARARVRCAANEDRGRDSHAE